MVNIFCSSRYRLNKKNLKLYTQSLLDKFQAGASSAINLAFVGKRKMTKVAMEYKDENVALPILSFSYLHDKNSPDNLVGEIVICYPQAVLLAAERERKVEDMMKQLIEHGFQNIFAK